LVGLSLALTACGSRQRVDDIKDVQVITKWKTYECGVPPEVDFVSLNKPDFFVIEDGKYTMTPDMYAQMGENFTLIIKAAKQLKSVIGFYESCIAAAQDKGE
jgi:hypothetical protein